MNNFEIEQFIRQNFEIVEYRNEDGTTEEGFEYKAKNGNKSITKLSFFINNTDLYAALIQEWESQGMNVPQ